MYCLKCSAENPYGANFCPVCAYPITANFNTVSNARQVEPLYNDLNDEILTEIKIFEGLPKRDAPVQEIEVKTDSRDVFAVILVLVFSLITLTSFLFKTYFNN